MIRSCLRSTTVKVLLMNIYTPCSNKDSFVVEGSREEVGYH